MRKKLKIILISLALFSAIGFGAVATYNKQCVEPEAEILRRIQREGSEEEKENLKGKLGGLPVLEAEEARWCALFNLSKKEKERIIEEKRKGHEDYLRQVEEWRKQGLLEKKEVPKSPFQGIWEGDTAPAPFRPYEFSVLNSWGGELDGKPIGVYAGYRPESPSQGVVVVFDDINDSKGKFYSVPTPTGPVRIIFEKNGVLTLKSVSGEFEVYDLKQETYPPKKVSVPGGATYYFDVKTRIFK